MPRRRLFAAAVLLSLLALTPGRLPAQPNETYRGDILVREVELVLDLPDLVAKHARANLRAEDLVVLEEGIERRVTKVGPLTPGYLPAEKGGLVETPAWTLVLYFDDVLAKPDTSFITALALAQQASRLTRLGSVEIVAAKPEPSTVLEATRDPQRLEAALQRLAAEARVARDRAQTGAGSAAVTVRTLPLLRRQCDRLVSRLTRRPGGGAQALFLVASDFDLSPRELNRLKQENGGQAPPPEALAAPFNDTARVLAAYGWVAVAFPMHSREDAGREHLELPDLEKIRASAGGGSAPPVIVFGNPDRSPLRFEGVIDSFIGQKSAPLLELAQETAGTLVAFEQQMDAALDGLSRRWHLWYETPDVADGRTRSVEVRFRDSAQPLRTRRWVRSSTPEGVAEARLRLLLAGGPPEGDLPLTVSSPQRQEGKDLEIRLAVAAPAPSGEAIEGAEGEPPSPVRVSLAYDTAAGPEIRHELIQDAALEKGWNRTLPVHPPEGARRVAVVVEDLARERWGETVLDLGNPGTAGAAGH